jgi:hypothetical protein
MAIEELTISKIFIQVHENIDTISVRGKLINIFLSPSLEQISRQVIKFRVDNEIIFTLH